MHDLRMLQRDEIPAAGAMLGRAFADNPAYAAMLGFLPPDARAAAIARVNTGFTQAAVRHLFAECAVEGGRVVAASLISIPGQHPPSVRAKLWQASGCVTTGVRGALNLLRMDLFLAKRHPVEPHFYLFVLGVEPAFQGRGLGKALLHRLNARADDARLPCWLETDKPTSVRLYQSVGYEVTEEATHPGLGNVRMWFMRRPAK